MSHSVQLTDETFARLQKLAVPLVDTIESVISGLLDYRDQATATMTTGGSAVRASTNTRDAPIRKKSPNAHEKRPGVVLDATYRGAGIRPKTAEDPEKLPEKAFHDPLLEALYELGGVAKPNQATELVGKKLASQLRPGDHKRRRDGKERWENIVHWNRKRLKDEGLLKSNSDRDIWELTDDGIRAAKEMIASRAQSRAHDVEPILFDIKAVPDLRHTKLLSAKVSGDNITPTWNGLLFHLIRLIPSDRCAAPDEARRLIIVNFVSGKKEDEGYQFVVEHSISVQGQGANDAWKGASHIAQKLGVPIEVEFLWRMKEGAARPGVIGRLTV